MLKTHLDWIVALLTGILVFIALWLVFRVVPDERTMGAVQRIFYFHVGSAIACYFSFAFVLLGSLGYLANGSRKMDRFAEASGEVGFLFCTIVLISGMIWARAAWNTWFRWEPRLVTFLLLWFIYLAFVVLRSFGDARRIASQSAILGIVGTTMVPLMVYSVKLLPEVEQLHPVVMEKGGLDPMMRWGLLWAVIAVVALQGWLVWVRTRIGYLFEEMEERGIGA